MLQSLKIDNYALIDELKISLEKGFTVITGETGAGKSILIGAISLLLGERADTTVLKNRNKKCIVEANFNIKSYNLKKFFLKNDLDYFEESIIRREINQNARSRAFINDTPVKLEILKQLGFFLVDIHSQHDTLNLNDTEFQLNVIDTYAQHFDLLAIYKTEFEELKKLSKELKEIQEKAEKEKNDLDYFQYQYEQLEKANLKQDEQKNLEEKQKTLNHAQEIKSNLTTINSIISNEDNSILSNIQTCINSANNIVSFYNNAKELNKRLDSVFIELQDLANETEVLEQDIEHNPEKLEFINARLNTIFELQQKYNVSTIEELLNVQNNFEKQISQIESFDDYILQKKNELDKQEQKIRSIANKITENRKKNIPRIEKEILSLLAQLGMPKAKFIVKHSKLETYSKNGLDSIIFLFSANNKIEAKQISKIASGGELSRLMLSLKFIISKSSVLPTIIFDEIDTGVSGDIADKVATIMKKMSRKIQVIDITHLPQIAAKADTHLLVYKKEEKETTSTNIKELNKEQRITELAKILSGKNITEAAIKNAKELLSE